MILKENHSKQKMYLKFRSRCFIGQKVHFLLPRVAGWLTKPSEADRTQGTIAHGGYVHPNPPIRKQTANKTERGAADMLDNL